MAQIKILKDNDKNTVYPQSVTQAIMDANGVNLDTILHNTVMTDAEEDVADIIVGYEDINNKVTEITEDSTDLQYPSAKAVYDLVTNQEVDLNGYYTKEESSNIFATKDKYGDAAISLGRRTDTGNVGTNSVAIGDRTQANGNYSVAMGSLAQANAMAAVALGREVRANGSYSLALGEGAIAKNQGEVAVGKWNIEDTTGKILHTVGNGTSSSARSNAYTIDNEGNAWFAGDIYVGSNSGTHKDEGSIALSPLMNSLSKTELVSKYNNPICTAEGSLTKMYINTPLAEYESGQKVNLYIVPQFEDFTGNAFPTDFTSNSKDGFKTSTTSKVDGNAYEAFTGAGCWWGYTNTPANVQNDMSVSIECPILIIPSTFYVKIGLPADRNRSGTFTIYGSKDGSKWDTLISQNVSTNKNNHIAEATVSCDTQENYRYFKIYVYSNTADDYTNNLYNFNITAGKKSTFHSGYNQTLRIGSLPEVPLEGRVEIAKKASLMYLNNKFIVGETEGIA